MPQKNRSSRKSCARLLTLPLLTVLSAALAAPLLPGNTVAETALSAAFSPPAPAKVADASASSAAQSAPATPVGQPVAATQPAAATASVKAAADKAAATQAAADKAAAAKVAAVKLAAAKAAAAKQAAAKLAATKAANQAARLRQQAIAQAQKNASRGGRSAVVHSTAYNSLPGQTDGNPFITATGTRTRFGTLALSRDLLSSFPYGTKVTLQDLSGGYNNMLAGKVFVIEDTMNPRISNTVDVWMSSHSQALQWGSRNIRITAVR